VEYVAPWQAATWQATYPLRPPSAPNNAAPQVETGSKIRFGRVLALKQEGKFTVGAPYLEGAAVEAEVLEELKGPKVGTWGQRWGGVGWGGSGPCCTIGWGQKSDA
jgi:hypothetical protein